MLEVPIRTSLKRSLRGIACRRRLLTRSITCTPDVVHFKPLPDKTRFVRPLEPASLPNGFMLTGVHCGIKKSSSILDLGIAASQGPNTAAAACFTRNAFRAAPVLVSEDVLVKNEGRARAVVVNSGCANAVTGEQGLRDAWDMAKATDVALQHRTSSLLNPSSETLVLSTGVIGETLPISRILSAIPTAVSSLDSSPESYAKAARAFMTTDTFPKLRASTFEMGGQRYRMAGMDKGAGMIHPNMGSPPSSLHATLLGLVLTDAPISPPALQTSLQYAVDRSFNAISVDGDMSTNDTIIVLANGMGAMGAAPQEITEADNPTEYIQFRDALTAFCQELAQLIIRDGEGATKFVTISVTGAQNHADAHAIASSISTSALVKTALYGEDANWGRILAAAGSVTLATPLIPTAVSVSFVPSSLCPKPSTKSSFPDILTLPSGELPLLISGTPVDSTIPAQARPSFKAAKEARASEILQCNEFGLKVIVGDGPGDATYWTCDFSYEYVRINGDYRS